MILELTLYVDIGRGEGGMHYWKRQGGGFNEIVGTQRVDRYHYFIC
jgi:hypothetical protein